MSDSSKESLENAINDANSNDKIILNQVALSGVLSKLEWKSGICQVFERQIDCALKSMNEKHSFTKSFDCTFESRSQEVLRLLNAFEEAPFTIQRLSELLLNYQCQYKSTHKLCNAMEKLLSVTTGCIKSGKDKSLDSSSTLSTPTFESTMSNLKRTSEEAISTDEFAGTSISILDAANNI